MINKKNRIINIDCLKINNKTLKYSVQLIGIGLENNSKRYPYLIVHNHDQ
jgi:hypothetical protein